MSKSWRDCKAWVDYGIPLTTTSNEASKLFDASLTQYVGWYNEESLGGLEATCVKTVEADPNFVMGHVIKNGLDVLGTGRTIRLDQEFDKDIKRMVSLAESNGITDRERKHVNAVRLWAEG
ncbi:tetratricopeptide repeat protein 38-like [Pecten maximus]|uniref:tetratricopeptide repeat protein 38-like n=1 Tax=Pecten maximus TaxID=6579 RepID=UPI0014590DC6|nr:tetratricopeptide repeat protein 38-like [Pecten maximus]